MFLKDSSKGLLIRFSYSVRILRVQWIQHYLFLGALNERAIPNVNHSKIHIIEFTETLMQPGEVFVH